MHTRLKKSRISTFLMMDDELKNHGTQVDQDDEDELKTSEVVPQPVNAAPDDPNSGACM